MLLSCSEPLTTDEMPYMDGEKETDAVELSERKPGQCEQFTVLLQIILVMNCHRINHSCDELSPITLPCDELSLY